MSIAFLKDMQAGSQGGKETQRDACNTASVIAFTSRLKNQDNDQL